MSCDDILIIKGSEVLSLLEGQETELIRLVRLAYEAHAYGQSSLPQSIFLRFPNDHLNRIIALPAYLGQEFNIAGVKWVSSFPGNLEKGIERASAAIILNSPLTGRPEAFIEGSIISAKRTAASAALAAQYLQTEKSIKRVGLVGGGLINFEIARFLLAVFPDVTSFILFDKDLARARQFGSRCRELLNREVIIAEDLNTALRASTLVSIATTATKPYIFDLSESLPGTTILHVSLRDFSPEVILACDNVVDDIDHVCRAQTSVHLAEQLAGNRAFIRCCLADILLGEQIARRDARRITIFNPFGLGILDLAVGEFVRQRAVRQSLGTVIPAFLPQPWIERL